MPFRITVRTPSARLTLRFGDDDREDNERNSGQSTFVEVEELSVRSGEARAEADVAVMVQKAHDGTVLRSWTI